jgi:phage replication initiation protein
MVLQDHPACQPDEGDVSIDTLSFTIDLAVIADLSPWHWRLIESGLAAPEANDNHFLWHAFQVAIDHIFGTNVLRLGEKFTTGRNFFRNSIALENKAGFVAFGGNNQVVNYKGEKETRHERIQVYISGEGCRQVPSWEKVYKALSGLTEFNPKITRIDIAFDDLKGKRDVDYARDSYRAGLFAGNGRPPKGQFIDDMGSSDGRTFYVGSRDSGRYLRVYEKGRQLGDKSSEWVRWEVELSAKQCDIPLRALVDYRSYLAGSYPCLDWIDTAKLTIESKKKREQIEFQHLVSHGRRAYGSLVNYMMIKRGMTPDQVVAALVREGLPGRLVWTSQEPESVAPAFTSHAEQHPHLYPEVHTVMRPVNIAIDWQEKQRNHWSNIHA